MPLNRSLPSGLWSIGSVSHGASSSPIRSIAAGEVRSRITIAPSRSRMATRSSAGRLPSTVSRGIGPPVVGDLSPRTASQATERSFRTRVLNGGRVAPRTYDADRAMDRALDLFWERGYEAVSVEDLVRVTGMNRFGLYHRWGDKRGLLLACLARYAALMLEGPLASLTHPAAGRAEIEALFAVLVAFATAPDHSRSCFVLD